VRIRRGTCGFDRSYKHEEEKNAESLLAEFHGRSTLLLEQGLDGSYAAGAHGAVTTPAIFFRDGHNCQGKRRKPSRKTIRDGNRQG